MYCDHFRRYLNLIVRYQGLENRLRDGFDWQLEYQLCNEGNVALWLKEVDVATLVYPWVQGESFYRCDRELPVEIPNGGLDLKVLLMSGVLRQGAGRGERFVLEFQFCSARGDCYQVAHDISGLGVCGEDDGLDRRRLPVMKVAQVV